MRAPWLHRWQDVVCLSVAGLFVLLVLVLGGDLEGGLLSAPYVAAVVFVATWLAIDLLIAWLVTRAEQRAAEAAAPPRPRPRVRDVRPLAPPRPARAPLPRAVARPRR